MSDDLEMHRRGRRRAPAWGSVLAAGLFGAGCSVVHGVDRNPAPPVELPPEYAGEGTDAEVDPAARWWTSFGDPELDRLVASAFEGNLDLEAAFSRLRSAQAASGAVIAGYIPQVNGSGRIAGSRINTGAFTGRPGAAEFSQTTVDANLSYEVDLWGRIYGLASAAEVEIEASASDVATMYITVSANVVDTWLQAIEQRALLALLDRQREANATYLELVELRFGQGLADALDVLQQRQQVAALDAQRPPVVARLGVLQRQLAVLLGDPPGAVEVVRTALPEAPPRPASGIPARLLQNRPDVRSARLRVVSADFQLGSAIANRFPKLNLTGSIGSTGFNVTSGLFEDWLGNLAAGLVVPLTDQVRLDAEQKQAQAQLDERVANFGQTVLTALREVEIGRAHV